MLTRRNPLRLKTDLSYLLGSTTFFNIIPLTQPGDDLDCCCNIACILTTVSASAIVAHIDNPRIGLRFAIKLPTSEFESPIDRYWRRLSTSECRKPLCEVSNRMAALLLSALLLCIAPAAGARTRTNDARLQGTVASGGHGLAGYQVSLYGSFIQSGPPWLLLGSGTTDSSGNFTINYTVDGSWNQDRPVSRFGFNVQLEFLPLLSSTLNAFTASPPTRAQWIIKTQRRRVFRCMRNGAARSIPTTNGIISQRDTEFCISHLMPRLASNTL